MNIDFIISDSVVCTQSYTSQLSKIVSDILNQNISTGNKIILVRFELESKLRLHSVDGILKQLF